METPLPPWEFRIQRCSCYEAQGRVGFSPLPESNTFSEIVLVPGIALGAAEELATEDVAATPTASDEDFEHEFKVNAPAI